MGNLKKDKKLIISNKLERVLSQLESVLVFDKNVSETNKNISNKEGNDLKR